MKSLAGKPPGPGRIGIGAVKVPTIASTFWKPSTVLIVTAGPGRDHDRGRVDDVDLLVVDRVDDARAGDADRAPRRASRPGVIVGVSPPAS